MEDVALAMLLDPDSESEEDCYDLLSTLAFACGDEDLEFFCLPGSHGVEG